jgi:hypothetical protein
VAKLKERSQKSNLESFELRMLNDVEVKEKYQVEISNRFSHLENLDESLGINSAWESITENIKTSTKDSLGYHRLNFNKPWFDDECSKLIGQWRQAKLQWLQNPSQINGDNLQNLRCGTSRTFRTREGNI